MDGPRRCVLYGRISLDKRSDGLGVDRQLAEARTFVERQGWAIVATERDDSISAMTGKVRPAFERTLEHVTEGRADTVVCWHLDRLCRKSADLQRVLDLAIAADAPCPDLLIQPVNGFPIRGDDPTARLTASILTLISQFESEHKAERIRAQQRQRALSGHLGSKRPYGLERPDVVQAVYAKFLATQSISDAHRLRLELDPEGPPSRNTTRQMLTGPWTAGIVVWDGVEHPEVEPQWSPAIDEVTYRRAQAILSRPSRLTNRQPRGTINRLGSGLFRCGKCGEPVIASSQAGTLAYKCRDHHISRASGPIDDLAFMLLADRLRRADVWLPLLPRNADPEAEALVLERDSLDKRLTEFHEDYAAGLLDRARALEGISLLRADLDAVDERLARFEFHSAEGQPVPYDTLETLAVLPLDVLRRLMHTVFVLTLHSQRGGPKVVKGQQRPPRPESVSIDWREEPPDDSPSRARQDVPNWGHLTDGLGNARWPGWYAPFSRLVPSRQMPEPMRRAVWGLVAPHRVGERGTKVPASPFVQPKVDAKRIEALESAGFKRATERRREDVPRPTLHQR